MPNTTKPYYGVNLSNWDSIQERYKSFIDDNINGQQLIIFQRDSQEAIWIEEQISLDLKILTGKNHKVKMAVLGGLCAGNTLHEHIDGHLPLTEQWSLNIPIKNYENFEMLWFDGDYIPTPRIDRTDKDSVLLADEAQNLRPLWSGTRSLKDSTFIKSPTVVQVNIPHQVINYSGKTRVVLAVRLTPELS